ncbi:MAG: HIT domain-containing protein [Holosporaceae bacterium]|jgi:diadenosine tetraphosphate (Ap4A) HIT family hydrolase|nr:HIT domain-containing protein [Holosporaceae bacterium]
MYNRDNVFYKILNGQIPCEKVYEDAIAVAFHDIHRCCRIHVLVITRGLYINFADFVKQASADEVKSFFHAVSHVANMLGVKDSGYRLLMNSGLDAGQEVEHFHVHILGGEPLGKKLK